MTVCRFFLQGTCRFGERCRFEHPDPDLSHQEVPRRNNYNDYSYQSSYNDNYNRRNYSGYNHGRRNDYIPHEDRYQSNYNQNRDYQYNQRYQAGRQYQTERYGGPGAYDDSSYGQANRFVQNKHEWVSEDYKRQRDQRRGPAEEFHNTSTPKSRANFSFRDPELQRKTDNPIDLHMNEQNLAYAELIKDDIKAWEMGSQWPFTCYSPIQERASFPGFNDISPEELRYEAYKARESNTYDSYLESVEKALQNINTQRNQLKNPSVQLMSIIEKYRSGEDVSSKSEVDGAFPFSRSDQCPVEDMLADESSMQQNSATFFGLKLPTSSSLTKSLTNFSFKLPSESDSKPTSSQAMDCHMYTSLDALSSADKEQFSASTFTLGKIPTVPPPQEICF